MDFYVTSEGNCSYKENATVKKLFTIADTNNCDCFQIYNLFYNGFRRDHNYIYIPKCENCNECKSLRVNVSKFKPSRTQQKIYNRLNKKIYVTITNDITSSHYNLFINYENNRHIGSEMGLMKYNEFCEMVKTSPIDTHLYEFRACENDELKGCMLIDNTPLGLSAVYSFYDTKNPKESLGTFMILKMIEWSKKLEFNHFYLGYYVKNSKKMGYKANFKPYELFIKNNWQEIQD
ncbi:MAG: arginyl-tRNA-protein transferase [Alphaproteobacteria bacterium ADurb.Bin438]|nr:MAG: arginyl-tRNA-protein transferase [Alphaproteobacteria bacterium ADurb.Bin438]